MSRATSWSVALAVALVGAAGLAGCSGGTGAASPTTSAPTTTTTVPVAASSGCGTAPDVARLGGGRPGDVAATFTSGGVDRAYRLAVPTGYDPAVAAPLVVNLHGAGSNAVQASVYGDVPRAAGRRGMVVVTPEALGGRWELAGRGADADFLAALVDDVEARYCIDLDRVHLIGMSLGAWKAAVTACTDRGRYASIALVTVEVFPGACAPMPVIAFHGTADPVVAYGAGGGTVDDADTPNAGVPGALANIARWAADAGCDPQPAVTSIGDDVVLRRYRGCDPGVGVELYTIEGGGHTWPGADIDIASPSMTTHTISATELALDWFEAHPRRPGG